MAMLLNAAGSSTGDPTLKGLAIEYVFASPTMDVSAITNAWIDTAAGFAGTNSISSSLSPAATVVTAANNGTYDDTNKQYTISSTTGLSVGDYVYLSHAALTAGVFKILAIPDGTHFTLVSNPLNTLGNKTGIAYQVAWRYVAVLGTAPLVSSGAGQINYFKVQATDAASNIVQATDTTYIEDPPSSTSYIAIASKNYDGSQTTNTLPNTFSLLGAWSNKGGVSHIAMANHSTLTRNDFTWGDNSTSEKTTATAVSSGLKVSAGDGIKAGRLLLRSTSGSAQSVGVDIQINLDTTAPTITMWLFGR